MVSECSLRDLGQLIKKQLNWLKKTPVLSNTAVKPPHQVNFLNQRFSVGVGTTLGGILEIGGSTFIFQSNLFPFRVFLMPQLEYNIDLVKPSFHCDITNIQKYE